LFPKVPDYHKPDRPLISNGLGIIYVLISVVYLFLLYQQQVVSGFGQSGSNILVLAVCILFGGFMGLLDDWMDLRWRYKAFLPLIAAIPLSSLAYSLGLRTTVSIAFLGTVDFGLYYYYIIIPLIVTITTNTVNQLGGLNGLETVCPAIIMIGLMLVSGQNAMLLYVPLAAWLVLTYLNVRGEVFVGNSGSFAIGMTLAAFAIIADLKSTLIISILPYIFNSSLILLTYFIYRTKANVTFDGRKLVSDHRRSLITVIAYRRPLTERQIVLRISLLVAFFTGLAMLIQWLPM
jgi:UDP-N-acetylglucosamine--dolichyl-phosphate N-acetylglucosaminephosphotransferase